MKPTVAGKRYLARVAASRNRAKNSLKPIAATALGLAVCFIQALASCARPSRSQSPQVHPSAAGAAPTLSATVWRVVGRPPGEFTGEGRDEVTDAAGATLSLRSAIAAPTGFGMLMASLPADSYRRLRMRVTGEIRTHRVVGGGASLWLRVDGPAGPQLLDNGTDRAIRDDSGWVEQVIVLPVTPDATKLFFGALLTGAGEMEVRRLRIEVLPAPAGAAPVGMAKTVLDSAVALVRARSMWRDTVSWSVILPEVAELARGASASAEVYPAIRVLLSRLGDHHSVFLPPQATTAFRTGGAENPPATAHALGNGIGYIAVFTYGGIESTAAQNYYEAAQASLFASLGGASCGWIVDLRANGGGNMYPMLAGLKPLLGDTNLGSFMSPGGVRSPWRATYDDTSDAMTAPAPRELAPLESAYVAVLTGPRTASSGEAVTISFRGRARTRSFGAPTAGFSTANETFALPDGAMIVLTTAIEADRTGREYGDKVDPDEIVPGANDAAADADSTVMAASKWLHARSGCTR
jgi:carboxyl-terminal processing protease